MGIPEDQVKEIQRLQEKVRHLERAVDRVVEIADMAIRQRNQAIAEKERLEQLIALAKLAHPSQETP